MRTTPAKRPMPWCSCTTRSPTARSVYEVMRSAFESLRRALRFALRKPLPAICVSVSTARRRLGYSSPAERLPVVMTQLPGLGRDVRLSAREHLTPCSFRNSARSLARRMSPASTTTATPALMYPDMSSAACEELPA